MFRFVNYLQRRVVIRHRTDRNETALYLIIIYSQCVVVVAACLQRFAASKTDMAVISITLFAFAYLL